MNLTFTYSMSRMPLGFIYYYFLLIFIKPLFNQGNSHIEINISFTSEPWPK